MEHESLLFRSGFEKMMERTEHESLLFLSGFEKMREGKILIFVLWQPDILSTMIFEGYLRFQHHNCSGRFADPETETAITCLETARRYSHSNSSVIIPMIYRFLKSDGHNLDVKSLDPTKMTLGTYTLLVDIILLVESLRLHKESLRLHKLFLRAMTHCFIALKIFLSLMVESSDSKAKIQEIKAKIQDKFNYNGNCKVKIGIIPDPGGEFKVCVSPF